MCTSGQAHLNLTLVHSCWRLKVAMGDEWKIKSRGFREEGLKKNAGPLKVLTVVHMLLNAACRKW